MTQPFRLRIRTAPFVSVYCTPGHQPTKTLIDLSGGMSRQPIIPAPLYFCAQRNSQPRQATPQRQLQMNLLAQSMEMHRATRRMNMWWLMIAIAMFIGVVTLLFIAGRGGG